MILWSHFFAHYEDLPHQFPVLYISDRKWGPWVLFFLLRKERGEGGQGWRSLFRSGFEWFHDNLVFFTDFSLTSVRRWPVFIRPFSLSYSMEQLSAYREGEQLTPDADLESGKEKTSGSSVSALPDLSQGRDSAPPSSVPAGLTGPFTCRQDLPSPASLPVLARRQDLAGVLPVPLPPEEPYDAFLLCIGCSKQDCAASAPQPADAVPPQDLVTLPVALPQPFPTYEGLVLTLRDPSHAPRLRMLLPGRCYVRPPQAWSWPGWGSTGICFNLFLPVQTLELLWTPYSALWADRLLLIFISWRWDLGGSDTIVLPPHPPPPRFMLLLHLLPQHLPVCLHTTPQSHVASLPAAISTLTAPPDV